MGIFVVLEGGEGSGKSTQANTLYSRLQQEGYPALLLHEPGGTPLGEQVRRLLKAQQGASQTTRQSKRPVPISPMAELLLFSAARAQLVSNVLRPALQEGRVVVCDRYTPSTVAYQGYGRGVPLETVEQANLLSTEGLAPDLVILLNIPPEEGLRRVEVQAPLALASQTGPGSRRSDEEGSRRFEEEPLGFHRKVRQGYLEQARADPERWLVVDATLPHGQVAELIWRRVEPLARRLQGRA